MEIKDRNNESKPDLEMTPMIDVVFLLLIFFMCATKFKVPDYRMDANLNKNKGLVTSNPVEFDDIPDFTISVEPSDPGNPRSATVYRIGRDLYITPENINKAVAYEYKLLADRAEAAGKTVPAVINGSGEVGFGYVVTAVNACKAAGVTEINFGAQPES